MPGMDKKVNPLSTSRQATRPKGTKGQLDKETTGQMSDAQYKLCFSLFTTP